MKKLYPHQQKFVDKNLDKALLAWEGGVGKSLAAVAWLESKKTTHNVVICPKRIKRKWKKELGNTPATILSYEEFKKTPPPRVEALVVDECDFVASPLFVPSLRSQRTEAMYNFLKRHNPRYVLLVTATPVRSSPANLHTILTFMGVHIEWKKWQERFYSLERRPFLPRPAWIPKKGWQKSMQAVLNKYADIVLLRDCVGALPPTTETVVKVKSPKFVPTEWEPSAMMVEEHRHENGEQKLKHIIDVGRNYRKVIVVCHYVEQLEEYAKKLSKEKETFVMYGKTKNQEEVIERATASDDCYLVVQASMSAGFDADTFSCVVFASMSYRVVDFVQMKFRVRRIHNLHPVEYVFLLGGRWDHRILETIKKGLDFVPAHYATTT